MSAMDDELRKKIQEKYHDYLQQIFRADARRDEFKNDMTADALGFLGSIVSALGAEAGEDNPTVRYLFRRLDEKTAKLREKERACLKTGNIMSTIDQNIEKLEMEQVYLKLKS